MDHRVRFKEPQFRFYKIKNKRTWTNKTRVEYQLWLNKNIGQEYIDWKINVSLRGTLFLYFLREDDKCLFILVYGECLA